MPMIMMSALTGFLVPPVALALLILPTFATNTPQAFRRGGDAELASARRFRLHIGAFRLSQAFSAQFVTAIPKAPMEAALGLPILGIIGGLYGGISGIMGPPLIVLLLSLGTPKDKMMRVHGVVFLIGLVALFAARLTSGLLNAETLPASD